MGAGRFSRSKADASVGRILVATDRSESADHAVEWAAEMAELYGAELLVLQVLLSADEPEVVRAEAELERFAESMAPKRGRARVVTDPDPSSAILAASEEEAVDVVVVGNVGMSGRREFLLGNVPNRVSHNARCTVVIVNTQIPEQRRRFGRR